VDSTARVSAAATHRNDGGKKTTPDFRSFGGRLQTLVRRLHRGT
jgi:hypothetical protein